MDLDLNLLLVGPGIGSLQKLFWVGALGNEIVGDPLTSVELRPFGPIVDAQIPFTARTHISAR